MRAKGRAEFRRHEVGKRLTATQAILANCFWCTGEYDGGKVDCLIKDCPLYPFMPYKEEENGGA